MKKALSAEELLRLECLDRAILSFSGMHVTEHDITFRAYQFEAYARDTHKREAPNEGMGQT